MALLNKQQLDQLADTVKNAETKTDAEIVTVLAHASDDYRFIPTMWAAMIALLTPSVLLLSPLWIAAQDLLLVQMGVFVFLAASFQIPALRYRLIPKRMKRHRAALMARRQFLEQGLHHTKDRTGVLIFVSAAEHYVEIMVDQGISNHIDNSQWQSIVTTFTQKVKTGAVLEGFEECVNSVAKVVSDVLPATHEQNELEDRLVVI
jgi:putative membrane protein